MCGSLTHLEEAASILEDSPLIMANFILNDHDVKPEHNYECVSLTGRTGSEWDGFEFQLYTNLINPGLANVEVRSNGMWYSTYFIEAVETAKDIIKMIEDGRMILEVKMVMEYM